MKIQSIKVRLYNESYVQLLLHDFMLPFFTGTLCNMGFVEQLVALLQREHDSTHEHLLSALLALTDGHPTAIQECRRPEFLLRELLENRVEMISGKDEHQVFRDQNQIMKFSSTLCNL